MSRRYRRHFTAATVTTAGMALALSACGSSHHPAATGVPTTPAATASVPPTTAGTATSAPSSPASTAMPSPTATAPSGPARCATAALTGRLSGANGTAGSIYYLLVLTNAGSSTCLLDGYAGVSFVEGSAGQQVGAPAARTPGEATAVTLIPGASAQATLQITDASNYCGSSTVATDGLRVYPPDQFSSLFIAHDDRACADTNDVTLHVGPFH